jgi:hypothetical protein
MRTPSKMPRSQIIKALAQQLKVRTDAYLQKKQRFDDELAHDLEQLYTAYGTDIVKMVLAAGGISTRRSRAESDGVPETDQPAGGERVKAKKDHGMGITELKPHVVEAIAQLKEGSFSCKDIGEILTAKGLKFDLSYVSYVLRHMDTLTVVERRKITGQGGSINIYSRKSPLAFSRPGSGKNAVASSAG